MEHAERRRFAHVEERLGARPDPLIGGATLVVLAVTPG
jgi:hypothetical protein